MAEKTIVITRFDPDKDQAPRKQEYRVPCEPDWKVLDAVNFIKDELDGSVPSLVAAWRPAARAA